ncbi:MAG: phospho-sugar mutase, partial [Clostridia bacterium]
MNYKAEYDRWCSAPELPTDMRRELLEIASDNAEIESRFCAPLSFGTAGLRGIMGAGINRMNIFTVRQATQGLARLIMTLGSAAMTRGVAICMDSRHMSAEFAREAACVLAGNKIRVYLFDALRPTPELSFAIRTIGCIAGINITASHNPCEYNGYKAYWEDGAQLPPAQADVVADAISKTDIFKGIELANYDRAVKKGLITIIGEEVDESFLYHVMEMAIDKDAVAAVADTFSVVYTPFHGAGHYLVPEALRRLGLKNIVCVAEQMVLDGAFPTVASPNPENKEGFALAIKLAAQHGSDLIIGTDPDADRVGVLARAANGDYVTISGNQMGVLLLDYIINAKIKTGTMPEKPCALKTIVTTEMASAVCEKNGVAMFETFTGFKFLAEKIAQLQGDGYSYLLAFEESYGYLMGDFCRDKDAVCASMMIAEMAAHYAAQGMTLCSALSALYEKYGYFAEATINLVMPGLDGL